MELQSPVRNVEHAELICLSAMKVALVLLLPLVASALRRLRGAKANRPSLEEILGLTGHIDRGHCQNKGRNWTKHFCGVPSSSLSKSKVIDFSDVQESGICSQWNQDR